MTKLRVNVRGPDREKVLHEAAQIDFRRRTGATSIYALEPYMSDGQVKGLLDALHEIRTPAPSRGGLRRDRNARRTIWMLHAASRAGRALLRARSREAKVERMVLAALKASQDLHDARPYDLLDKYSAFQQALIPLYVHFNFSAEQLGIKEEGNPS